MDMPAILQGDSLVRLIQGAVAGALATIVIGFGWAAGRSERPPPK